MKTIKMFALLFATLMSGMLVAQNDTTAVRVKLTAANGRMDNVYLLQNTAFHANTKDVGESTKMMNAVPNVNIYVAAPYGDMSTLKTNDLMGTRLAIQTNSQTEYTLSFDWLKGGSLYLKDNVTGAVIPVTASQQYAFTAEAKATIADRFSFVAAPVGGTYEICHRYGRLQISNYPVATNTDNIVVKDEAGAVVKEVAPMAVYQEIDLSGLAAGHYTVEANGQTLTISVQ